MKKFRIGLLIVFITLLLCLTGFYLFMFSYYKGHYFPNTSVNNIEIGNMTAAEAKAVVQEEILRYSLTVIDKDGNEEKLWAIDFDLTFTDNGQLEALLENQNTKLWFVEINRVAAHEVTVSTSFDERLLTEAALKLGLFQKENIVEPEDAYLSIADNRYQIMPEVEGSKPINEAVLELIRSAAAGGEIILDLREHDVYEKPDVYADDAALNADMEARNEELEYREKYEELEIVHEFDSQKETLTWNTIQHWVTFGDDRTVTVDREKVFDYVQQLASKYNTFGSTRTIISSRGQEVQVVGGDYGWVIYKEGEINALVKLIESGTSETREPLYELRAETHDGVDTGNPNTYVEIDLDGQHLWFYKDGALIVESDIVSGTVNSGRATRTGTYSVMFKDTNCILAGEGYEAPVDYFIPFYPDVGLHDANWQSSFGGNIYKSNGSRGCINMPHDKVEKIFNLIEVGTIVYVY